MGVEVRRVRPDEGPALRAMRLRALANAPMAFGSTLARESAFTDDVWTHRAAGDRDRAAFVAHDEGRWVGIATALAHSTDQPGPSVVGMFVEPAARGRGVVAGLLDAVARWVRERGGRQLYLWVTSTNAAAIRAYTRYGFRPTGDTQPLAHTPSVPEIRMVCDLAEAPLIRIATPADARGIAETHVRGWQAAYRGLLPDAPLAALSVETREETWRRVIARMQTNALQRVWVAERAGEVVGFAATGVSRDDDAPPGTGEVYAIYIEPDLIGTGLGRRLFAHAVDTLASQGFTGATLWVLGTNAASRRFYEAAGWQLDGREKRERWEGVDLAEVRYARRLTSA